MSDTVYEPIFSFPDQSPSFVNGFEAGLVWAEVERGKAVIKRTVHAQNEEVFRRMAKARGYAISFDETEGFETWAELELTKKPEDLP